MPKKVLINIAAGIIKKAYQNKGKIEDKDIKIFFIIPQKLRLQAQRYVNLGMI